MLQNIVLFFITFIVVFIVYQFIFARDYKNNIKLNHQKKNKVLPAKRPVEIRLLETYYKVDIKKINYSGLLNKVAVISSLDIALIVTIACLFRNGIFQILCALVLIIPIIYISYYILAKYYNRKIKIKEEKAVLNKSQPKQKNKR